MATFKPVDQRIDFPASEKRILEFWKENNIFQKSLDQSKGKPPFVFYEGPPTANGTPHNGHVLTRVIKDVFPRYRTMRGYHVPRKAGWDTHGLPVEVEVEKELGIHGKEAIQEYGIEAFTKKCIESVFRYTDVWEDLTDRIGFWVDLDEAYVTFHKSYVESVWWALSELFKKGLLYQGHKIIWWWPQGGTALSSAEVGLGYKTVDDPSVTVKFAVDGAENTYFLGWTTTPWTLPSNCALSVRGSLEYVYAKQGDETFIVAKACADGVLGEGNYEVVKTVTGDDLKGTKYKGVFEYATPETGKFWEVITADFVEAAATGVVHTAPAFGEDDYKAAMAQGIGFLQMVGSDGKFVPEATDFAGRFCKDADRDIIRNLKSRGLLYKEEVYRHDYPFCWRAMSDPLIQYARPGWFIRTTEVIDRAIANNQTITWHPNHIKDGRFGDFLDNNVDWALSRERFWGTPLNIWICDTCEHHEAPASVGEIEAHNPDAFAAFKAAREADPSLSEHLVVHKPWIDNVTFTCPECGGGTMKRIPEVIDCWFDSGCMPFAQWGYPHKGKEMFELAWPADFISEGIDQTRGWFYSLLMISTLLFDEKGGPAGNDRPHPYKNCIVLGHVADKHGKKESKSKGNFTPPAAILDSDGADAMRWYFYAANPPYNSTRYSADAVRQGQQEFLVKLRNVYAFFVIYGNIDGFDPRTSPRRAPAERSVLDRWMLSELNLALREVTENMDAYRVYEAAQRIIRLTDALSNWYVRRSRSRFWAGEKDADKWDAYHTLYEVLATMTRMTAPFVPFITEDLYQNLVAGVDPEASESVHLCDWPKVDESLIDESLSVDMQAVRDIVSLGLSTRAMHKIKVRQPLSEAEVILGDVGLTDHLMGYRPLIAEELNVKEVVFTQDAGDLVTFSVKPNYRALGPVFGKRMPLVRKALDGASADEVRTALATTGTFGLTLSDGEAVELTNEQVAVSCDAQEGFAASGGGVGVVVLNTTLTDELVAEGLARDAISVIQKLRKDAKLDFVARINVWLSGDADILAACEANADTIASEVLAAGLHLSGEAPEGAHTLEQKVGGKMLKAALVVA